MVQWTWQEYVDGGPELTPYRIKLAKLKRRMEAWQKESGWMPLDSVVGAINKYSVDNNLNIFAYKVRSLRCFELAISHNMPNNLSDINLTN